MNARSRVSLDGRGHEAQKGAFRGTQAPVDARDYRNRWSRRGCDRELAHPPRFSRVSARALSSNYEPSSAAAAATTRAARPRAGSVRAFQPSHVDSRCLWAPPTPRLSVIPRLSRCVPLIHWIRAALSDCCWSSSRHAAAAVAVAAAAAAAEQQQSPSSQWCCRCKEVSFHLTSAAPTSFHTHE